MGSADDALVFQGIAVYKAGAFWRISYTGTILHLDSKRDVAMQCARIYSNHFRMPMRVFD
jgi:hypothetical protein